MKVTRIMKASIPRIGIQRMTDEKPNISDIAVARLRAMQPSYPTTLLQAVARIESLLAAKNDAVTAALESARRIEYEAERALRFADYRRLLGEAEGVRQALDEISGGQS